MEGSGQVGRCRAGWWAPSGLVGAGRAGGVGRAGGAGRVEASGGLRRQVGWGAGLVCGLRLGVEELSIFYYIFRLYVCYVVR